MPTLKEMIKERLSVEQFYSSRISFVTKHGKNWSALCPFHADTNPSFNVEIGTGLFYCQGCKAGGDIFAYEMKAKGLTFNEALRSLAKEAGVDVPEPDSPPPGQGGGTPGAPGSKRGRGGPPKYPPLTDESIAALHAALPPAEREYLHGRGISDEVIDRLKIGYWPGCWMGPVLVWPVSRTGKWHNLRFYRKADDRRPKDIRQMPADYLGHDPIWLFPEPDPKAEEVYLFEGETDCMVALTLGLNATTITGGAGTWRDEFLPYFKDKKVCVCYDIDQPGKIGSKAVSNHISKVATEVRRVKLDLDEEKYPKGDFSNYIVQEKHTLADFIALAQKATVEVHLTVEIDVVEEDGSYWSVKTNKKGELDMTQVSNFTIRLVCRYLREDIIIREIVFQSEDGKKTSGPKMLESEQMAVLSKFRAFCLGSGDFIFNGDEQDMLSVWHLVCAQDPDARLVHEIYQVGMLSYYDLWLLENAVVKDGHLIKPDERGVCWNGRAGYILRSIDMSGDEESTVRRMPNLQITDDNTWPTMAGLCDALINNIGGWDVLLGLGLVVGSIYFRDILTDKRIGCFPVVFVYGEAKSGKTEYISHLMRVWGMEKPDIQNLTSITSTVTISRHLSYFSSIPTFWDELRNNHPRIDSITGIFRGAYDGSGRSVGVKGARGVAMEPVRSPLVIGAEQVPLDEAFRSRLIPILIRKSTRRVEHHREVLRHSIASSAHTLKLILKKNEHTKIELIDQILDYVQRITSVHANLDTRTVKNYAVALGCYKKLVRPEDEIIEDYVINGPGIVPLDRDYIEEEDEEPNMSQALDEFMDGVQITIESGALNKGISWYDVCKEEDMLYVWLSPLYEAFAIKFRSQSGQNPPGIRTITHSLRNLKCCVEVNKSHKIKVGDTMHLINKKCVAFRLSTLHPKIRGWIGGDY